MAMLRWDPWGDLAALQRDVDELFGRVQGRSGDARSGAAGGWVPPVDAFRTEEALVVRMELPGVRPDGVEVSVHEGVLSVAGERPLEADISDEDWLRRERPVGRFERSLTLPESTDPGGITASFENGVLELRVPHPPERKPHRVSVTTGGERTAVDVGEKSA
jgi:HSP20 family protein